MYRKVKGIDADSYARTHGIGLLGGAFARYDDGNAAWEDIEDEDAEIDIDNCHRNDLAGASDEAPIDTEAASLAVQNAAAKVSYIYIFYRSTY